MDKVFNKVIDSLKEKNKKFSNKIYSYTIIYSLEEFNVNQENHLRTLLTEIIKICDSYFNQPFLILLSQDESDKKKVINFFNKEEIQNIGLDQRNISYFISPINSNNNEKNEEMIKQKIFKIFSYFYELGDDLNIKKSLLFYIKELKKNIIPLTC